MVWTASLGDGLTQRVELPARPAGDFFGLMAARLDQRCHGLVAHALQGELRVDAQELAEARIDLDQPARRIDGARCARACG